MEASVKTVSLTGSKPRAEIKNELKSDEKCLLCHKPQKEGYDHCHKHCCPESRCFNGSRCEVKGHHLCSTEGCERLIWKTNAKYCKKCRREHNNLLKKRDECLKLFGGRQNCKHCGRWIRKCSACGDYTFYMYVGKEYVLCCGDRFSEKKDCKKIFGIYGCGSCEKMGEGCTDDDCRHFYYD